MVDPIKQQDAPVLRKTAKPILKKEIGSSRLARLIEHMQETLKHEDYGVALAAPQMGEGLRLFVVAGRVFEKEEEDDAQKKVPTEAARTYINPEITRRSRKKKEMSEGCLSVRGQYGAVMRHEKVTLKALDEAGKPLLIHASGLLAHIFQHEVDHLDGILFLDKAVRLEPWEDFKKRTSNEQ